MTDKPQEEKVTVANPSEQRGRARIVADLLTAQSNHIAALKWAIGILEGKITLRNSLAEVQADALKTPFNESLNILKKIRDEIGDTGNEALLIMAREVEAAIESMKRAVASIGDWLNSSTDPTILYPREALQRVRMIEIVERAIDDLGSTFDRSRLIITVPQGLYVTTAPARLAAILTVLLENAHRHAGPGDIDLICAVSQQEDLKIIVGDRGPGLQGESPEEWFKPKPQLLDDTNEWAPLLGLGLFMARMMAESLGGKINLEDREGGGLLAKVVLPQRRRKDIELNG